MSVNVCPTIGALTMVTAMTTESVQQRHATVPMDGQDQRATLETVARINRIAVLTVEAATTTESVLHRAADVATNGVDQHVKNQADALRIRVVTAPVVGTMEPM